MSRERLSTAKLRSHEHPDRHTDPTRALETCDQALKRLAEIKDHPGAHLHEVEALAASTYPFAAAW